MTSSPQPTLTAPQANLALYGALDDILIQALGGDDPETGDPETAARVNQYLPGAAEHPGWAQELRDIFGPVEPTDAEIGDTVAAALDAVLANGRDALTIPDLANLVYAVGALVHFDAANPLDNSGRFVQVLALAGTGIEEAERLERAGLFLYDEDNGLLNTLSGWQAWPSVIQTAAANGWVEPIIASVPQCSTSVVTVNGLECVAIDTEATSPTITFDDLIDVVDPRNWPDAYPAFFCEMYPSTSRAPKDKWWDVKETVGFCPVFPNGGLGLTQRLRFLKSKQSPTDARLDFDLAEDQTDCGDKVLVDKGFVNVTCTREDKDTSKGGVKLTTKKVAHIKGISPYAQAFWLCKLGYGWIAMHLFFGKFGYPDLFNVAPSNAEWKDPPVIDEPDNDPVLEADEFDDDGSGASGGGGSGAAGLADADAAPPADGEIAVATKTAKRLADVANYLTKTNLDLTKKWLDGGLNFGDLAKYGSEVGGRLASEPWKWLHEITTGTTPTKPPGGTP